MGRKPKVTLTGMQLAVHDPYFMDGLTEEALGRRFGISQQAVSARVCGIVRRYKAAGRRPPTSPHKTALHVRRAG